MSNTAQSSASKRIEALLDENSFVEIGSMVTARATDFNMQDKETPADGVVTGYGVIDGNGILVEIDSRPFQSDNFTASKSVESTQEDRNLQRCSLGSFKEFLYLITGIKTSGIPGLFGAFYLICWIGIDHFIFYSIL